MLLASPEDKHYPPRATAVTHAWLRGHVHRQLVADAARLGEHPDRLAARILEAAVMNGYVDAIINLPR